MTIGLRYVEIEWLPDGCTTRFLDGAHYEAQPHHTDDYSAIATRCGYRGVLAAERLRYAREHDFCHSFVAERIGGEDHSVCPILWTLAHGKHLPPVNAARTEALVQMFQRWLRADERPILIDGIDWWGMKRDALALLAAETP